MTEINDQSRRKFLKDAVKTGVMLPFAAQLLGQHVHAANAAYENVLFIYHPNGLWQQHWGPSFVGSIPNTQDELSFGLGELKSWHQNIIVLKNIYINIQTGGSDGGEGGGHLKALAGLLTGDHQNDSLPSIDHLIAEKLPGNKGALNLGVRTGTKAEQILSKPRGASFDNRQPPNCDPMDVGLKLTARCKPVPGNPLQTKVYDAALADLQDLPMLDANNQQKITEHRNALTTLQKNQSAGQLNTPFNPNNVRELMSQNQNFDTGNGTRKELIQVFPDVCKAQIDNAIAAFANNLHNVATLQLSTCNGEDRSMYSFDECYNMMKLARARNVGKSNVIERPADYHHGDFLSHGPSHEGDNNSFQGQVRWHFSLVKYALDRLKEENILDKTLVVMCSEEGAKEGSDPHAVPYGGIVVAGGNNRGLQMGRVIDCGSKFENGTHKLFGDIARLMGTQLSEGPWKSGIIT